MPIRTNRGRSAVYRRLWGWPLRSPRHLITFVIIIIALGIIVAMVIPRTNSTGSAQPAGDTTSTTAGSTSTSGTSTGDTTTTPQTRLTTPLLSPTPAPPDPHALDVAVNWVKAWATHPAGITNAQWLAQLKPYTTDEFLPQMATVDPANVPATKVTGSAVSVDSTTSSVVTDVPTDGGTIQVTVITTPNEGWRVSKFDKAG
ncbi:hypothetical protein [Kutzneria buriramensis]|uniref:Uncharacterized protein n=1 Tax=Kutzneria buriramensis TaxID=1045776 RepID=A0A3E0HCA9_9PSEU|nr:hypothetical protein [Kutzneria buriramensis]REH42075.1 hypothetical protein BCF44_111381 [Kutzneria buriramensis]